MAFKVGDYIVYPVYGIGKIAKKYQEQINGNSVDYFQIQFKMSPIDISVAVDGIEESGVRYPLVQAELEKKLKNMHKVVKMESLDLDTIEEYCREKMKTGSFDDAIEVYNTLNSLSDFKSSENKSFSYTHSQRLEMIQDYLRSEITHVLGEAKLAKYSV